MARGKIELICSDGDPNVGYLSLPEHPGKGIRGAVVKQIRLIELCPEYKGSDIYLDFDADNTLVGIEIVG